MSTLTEYSGTYRIESLKGADNYLAWRIQMSDILFAYEVWDHIEGMATTRPEDTTLALIWDKADRKALTAIRLRISAGMMTYVLSVTMAKAAWDALANVFNTQGALAKVLARRRFLRYQIEEEASMEEEIRKIRQLREELALLNSKIEDDEFAITLLTALPLS